MNIVLKIVIKENMNIVLKIVIKENMNREYKMVQRLCERISRIAG